MDHQKPPWIEPRTAYIHIPFCAHHCGYCDFAVAAGQDHLIELYLDALALELASLIKPRPIESLFIGGGTPTHLSPEQIRRLLQLLRLWLPLQTGEAGVTAEFSIESNPDSLTPEKAAVLAEFGVNRVSIGVQSFRGDLLSALDRIHTPAHIPGAVEAARRHGAAVSLDLIFAAPGSSLAMWDDDLSAVLEFQPQHISTYGLTYEKGTGLWKSRQRGAVAVVPEEIELDMYERSIYRLAAAGYEHYEISNFARLGHRCRHNLRYWANEAYYGFGVGAASYVDGRRDLNVRDTKLYIRRVLAGESPAFQSERLEPQERAFETIATQLRRCDGINRVRFQQQTGYKLDDLIGDRLKILVESALLSDDGASVKLTRRGKCVGDGIIEDLMRNNNRPRTSA